MMQLTMEATMIVLMTALLSTASGADTFQLEAKLVSYSNPRHTLGPETPQCCDGGSPPDACNANCDNKFVFCLREPLHTNITRDIAGSCTPIVYTTPPFDNDDIQFGIGSSAIPLSRNMDPDTAPNPLPYAAAEWSGVAQFVIEVIDADDPMGSSNDQYIDTVLVDLSHLTPSTTFTPVTTHTGIVGHSSFELAFRLSCSAHYYGPTCSVYCEARNNASGHFSCDSQGNIVCSEGYTDESTYCVQCVPAPSCSPVGGFCTAPGGCVCRPGYNGSLCDVDLDPCEHASPCLNGGNCSSSGPDQYECSCPLGYGGEQCQHNSTSVCSVGSCMNGGQCTNDRCVCVSGYTGELCESESHDVMGAELVVILASSLAVFVVILILALIFVTCCIIRATRRQDKTQKMKSMDVPISPSTDSIELHKNPGYAFLGQTPDSPHYAQIVCPPVGSESQRSTPHQPQTGQSPSHPPSYDDGYVNEGLGPKNLFVTKTRHFSDPLHMRQTVSRPVLDDSNYAIPHKHNSLSQLVSHHT